MPGSTNAYSERSDILTASRRERSTHTWRAILDGRMALRDGLTKRVGDDKLRPNCNSALILCGMWAIWYARNDRRHGVQNSDALVAEAFTCRDDVKLASEVGLSRVLLETDSKTSAPWFLDVFSSDVCNSTLIS